MSLLFIFWVDFYKIENKEQRNFNENQDMYKKESRFLEIFFLFERKNLDDRVPTIDYPINQKNFLKKRRNSNENEPIAQVFSNFLHLVNEKLKLEVVEFRITDYSVCLAS